MGFECIARDELVERLMMWSLKSKNSLRATMCLLLQKTRPPLAAMKKSRTPNRPASAHSRDCQMGIISYRRFSFADAGVSSNNRLERGKYTNSSSFDTNTRGAYLIVSVHHEHCAVAFAGVTYMSPIRLKATAVLYRTLLLTLLNTNRKKFKTTIGSGEKKSRHSKRCECAAEPVRSVIDYQN